MEVSPSIEVILFIVWNVAAIVLSVWAFIRSRKAFGYLRRYATIIKLQKERIERLEGENGVVMEAVSELTAAAQILEKRTEALESRIVALEDHSVQPVEPPPAPLRPVKPAPRA